VQEFFVFEQGVIKREFSIFALVQPDKAALVVPGDAELEAETDGFAGFDGEIIRKEDALDLLVVFGELFIGHGGSTFSA